MRFNQTLREKLKHMPRIEPRADRETVRRNVLAEVRKREQQPKKKRVFLLPTVLTAAVAALMVMVLSPWVMQKTNQTRLESGDRSSGGDFIRVQSDDQRESDLSGNEETDTGERETLHEDDPSGQEADTSESNHLEKESASEGGEGEQAIVTQAPHVEYMGTVHKEMTIEGMPENVAFERYIFQPYGLQILIPLMTDGEKWYDEPQIDAGLTESAVFESRMQQMDNDELLLSSITVTAHQDQSLAEIKQDEIATEEENAKELGYRMVREEESLANGERLMFIRSLQGADGTRYRYIREVFLTEQNSRTFAFHIGRHEITSDGWDPRLKNVVYPELRIVK